MSGYVFDVHIQNAKRLFMFVFPLYFLFFVFLCVETVKHRFAFAFLLCTTIWMLLIVWILYCQIKLKGLHKLSFSCKGNKITNYCDLGECVVSTKNSFYFTCISQSFGYGKATLNKEFFLFSEKPFATGVSCGNGLFTFKKLWMQEVVVLPKSDKTQEWVLEITKLKQIPQYPKVACFIKRQGDKGTVLLSPPCP